MIHTGLAVATYAVPWIAAAMLWRRLQVAIRSLRDVQDALDAPGSTLVRLVALPARGDDFDGDARFDLFTNGDRAGYAMTPDQVKTEIVEGLDIDMRELAGFAPPSR